MFFFEGASCPVCGKEFDEKSDIVTCPVCGTPHHRECYAENGECVNVSRHEEGFNWTAPEKDVSQGNTVRCHKCGFENPEGMLYCGRCTAPLFMDENGQAPSYGSDFQRSQQQSDNGYYSFGSSVYTVSDNELIDGVTVDDLKHFVGNSWYYYVSIFYRLFHTGKKTSFNLIAFFTHGLWFISRKMYLLGILFFSVMLSIDVFQVLNYDFLMSVTELIQSGNQDAAMIALSEQPIISGILFGSAFLKYIIMFVSGLLGNRIYMKHCVKRIKNLKEKQTSREAYCMILEEKGGVSFGMTFIFIILYLIIQYYLSSML